MGALYSAFVAMLLAAHVPPAVAVLSLALTTNIFGGITHYASGQSVIYYGAGALCSFGGKGAVPN